MARLGTITVPVHIKISTDTEGVHGIVVPAGNTNPSLTNIAAAMNGLSLDEFARLGAYEQGAYRDLAHNLSQVYALAPR